MVGGGWEPDKKKGRKRASSYTQRMRRFRRCSERRVRKPTKKKNAETSSPKHHKGFFAAQHICCFTDMLTKSNEKRTRRSLSHERWSADGNCKMDGKMQSNKKGSPTFPQLHVSERTEPRVSQLNGDQATESGLTTQVLLLKSLESNGDRRNYLSS